MYFLSGVGKTFRALKAWSTAMAQPVETATDYSPLADLKKEAY